MQVGEPVVVIVEDEEMVPAFSSYTVADAVSGVTSGGASAQLPSATSEPEQVASFSVVGENLAASSQHSFENIVPVGRTVASPYARKLAHEQNIAISNVQGSGPGGRVVAQDVHQAITAGISASADRQAVAGYTEEEVKQVQKVTARRLLESKRTVPHYYLTYECQVDKLLSLKTQFNEHLKEFEEKVSVNDFVIKASAAALRTVPDLNSSWHGDFVRQYHNVDVSVAVQTPGGLMVPVVRDADLKGLRSVSQDVKCLAAKVCYVGDDCVIACRGGLQGYSRRQVSVCL